MERLGARVTGGENFQELGLRTSHFFTTNISDPKKTRPFEKTTGNLRFGDSKKATSRFFGFFLLQYALFQQSPAVFRLDFFPHHLQVHA